MKLVDIAGAAAITGVVFTLAALVLLMSGGSYSWDDPTAQRRKTVYRRLGFIAASVAATAYVAGIWLGAASGWGQA